MEEYRSLDFVHCVRMTSGRSKRVSEGPILAPESIFSVVVGAEDVLARII